MPIKINRKLAEDDGKREKARLKEVSAEEREALTINFCHSLPSCVNKIPLSIVNGIDAVKLCIYIKS